MTNEADFGALGLSEQMLQAVRSKGFEVPTSIQKLTIPRLLDGTNDMIAQSQTGTGKTAAFGLPILQQLEPSKEGVGAIILVPTRELALQAAEELLSFNAQRKLSITAIYGGAAMSEQLRRLSRGVDIVVGTPGRVLDHIRRGTLKLNKIRFLVLDEADEMLNMGFVEDVEEIMSHTSEDRRVMLFSATMPQRIIHLSENYMRNTELLRVESRQLTADLTNQIYFEVRESDKFDALTRIIDVESDFYGIVFCRTKISVDEVTSKLLKCGYAADGLHGDVSQAQREKILRKFKDKSVNILVATDVAARGIDVSNLSHVINYSLPQDSESYVHRIGRTGRAGNEGTAITFISSSEFRKFNFMMRDIKADVKKETLPSAQDVVAMKRTKIKDDLQEIITGESYGIYDDMAKELLESYSSEVALSALLRLAFRDELDQNNYPEIRTFSVDRKGKARLFLSLGGKDGYDARKMVDLLKRKCGLRDKNIDDLRIFDSYSFVSVPFSDAEMIVRQINTLDRRRQIARIAKDEGADGGAGAERRPRPERAERGERPARAERPAWGERAERPSRKKESSSWSGEAAAEKPARKRAASSQSEEASFEKPARKPYQRASSAEAPAEKPARKRETPSGDAPASEESNAGFDWAAFQRYDEGAAWDKPKKSRASASPTQSVRKSPKAIVTGRDGAAKRVATKAKKW